MKILYVDPVVYVDAGGVMWPARVMAFEVGAETQGLVRERGDEGPQWIEAVPQTSHPVREGDPVGGPSWFALPGSRTVRFGG